MVIRATDNHMASGKPYAASLFKTRKGEYSLHGKDASMWGQMHELTATEEYKNETGKPKKNTKMKLETQFCLQASICFHVSILLAHQMSLLLLRVPLLEDLGF